MRLVCSLIVLCLTLGPGAVIGAGAALAQDFVKYRRVDGSIGFAQDLTGVPAGAVVIPSAAASPPLQIVKEAPALSPRGGNAWREHERRQNQAIREVDRAAAGRKQETKRISDAIYRDAEKLEKAKAERGHACRRGSRDFSGHRFWVDPAGCKRVLQRIKSAEASLRATGDWLDEEGLDVEDYLRDEDEAEEADEPQEQEPADFDLEDEDD